MHRFTDNAKMDIGLVSQALNNTNATGRYFNMSLWRTAVAILNIGAMAAGTTATLELLQAQDAGGTGSKVIPPSPATELATAQIAANTNVSEATLTCATVIATNVVTINGLTFTAIANGGTPAAGTRQFAVGTGGTANADTATALAAIINDTVLGVPGITASANAAVVTLNATNPGEALITITNPSATITPATTKAMAFIDLDVSQLDVTNGFDFIAVKIATTANSTIAATLLRALGRYIPLNQKAGASAVV
jgi:hypothetical protein